MSEVSVKTIANSALIMSMVEKMAEEKNIPVNDLLAGVVWLAKTVTDVMREEGLMPKPGTGEVSE